MCVCVYLCVYMYIYIYMYAYIYIYIYITYLISQTNIGLQPPGGASRPDPALQESQEFPSDAPEAEDSITASSVVSMY